MDQTKEIHVRSFDCGTDDELAVYDDLPLHVLNIWKVNNPKRVCFPIHFNKILCSSQQNLLSPLILKTLKMHHRIITIFSLSAPKKTSMLITRPPERVNNLYLIVSIIYILIHRYSEIATLHSRPSCMQQQFTLLHNKLKTFCSINTHKVDIFIKFLFCQSSYHQGNSQCLHDTTISNKPLLVRQIWNYFRNQLDFISSVYVQ